MSAPNSSNRANGVGPSDRPNTIGLRGKELSSVLDRLDGAESKGKVSPRREFARWPFRQQTVEWTVWHPGGSKVTLKLVCRNLSWGGAGLLHNGFVHTGSMCSLVIRKSDGTPTVVEGVVQRCSHRGGTLHEIGMKFIGSVDVREYVAGASPSMHVVERVAEDKLEGRVLYVEDCGLDVRIVQHFLKDTSIRLKHVTTGAAARAEAPLGWDVILTDWRLPDMRGTELVMQLREMGVATPILIVTADPVGLVKEGLSRLSGVGMLVKPLAQQQLLRTLAERLMFRQPAEEVDDDSRQESVIADLAREVSALVRTLDTAIGAKDAAAITETAMQIRGFSPILGMAEASRLADRVVSSASAPEHVLFEAAGVLAEACRRAARAA